MSQATDVTIAGAGYMVAPGTYRRASDGLPEGRIGRVVARDFFGGQHRAIQLERDRGWDGLSVRGAYGGQGVEPWPRVDPYSDTGIAPEASFAVGKPCPHLVVGTAGATRAYVWINGKLYRCPTGGAASWANLTLVADLTGFPGKQLAQYVQPGPGGGNRIAVALDSNADMRLIDPTQPPASAVSTFNPGQRASHVVGYGGVLVYGGGNLTERHILKMSDGEDVDTRPLDSPIAAMSLHQGKVAIATRFGLWLLGGRWLPETPATDTTPRIPGRWQGEPEPFFSSGFWTNDDDYAFLISYGGKLYTWLAHQVMEYDPGQGTQRQGWRSTGLEGIRSYGACVAGGYLIVVVESARGETETWAFDGSGWWVINRRQTGAGATPCWPLPTAGAANTDLLLFRDGSATYDLCRLIPRSTALPAFASSGQYRTSLLDGGERDRQKAWRRVGASFAVPEPYGNQASTDSVTVQLWASLNGGESWLALATSTSNDPTRRVLDLTGDLPGNAAPSTFIQLRVTWSSVMDWTPVLVGLWAEYELLEAPSLRRRWAFGVRAKDAAVERDGAMHARTGRELAADLWTAWRLGATVTFRDVDYDVTATDYRVRIVGIEEEIARPADQGRWGDATIRLALVEV